jgi:hypothetical protein
MEVFQKALLPNKSRGSGEIDLKRALHSVGLRDLALVNLAANSEERLHAKYDGRGWQLFHFHSIATVTLDYQDNIAGNKIPRVLQTSGYVGTSFCGSCNLLEVTQSRLLATGKRRPNDVDEVAHSILPHHALSPEFSRIQMEVGR